MWIETLGKVRSSPMVAGATIVGFLISRCGPRPNATAAISSIRAIAMRTRGTRRIRPSVSANAEPKMK